MLWYIHPYPVDVVDVPGCCLGVFIHNPHNGSDISCCCSPCLFNVWLFVLQCFLSFSGDSKMLFHLHPIVIAIAPIFPLFQLQSGLLFFFGQLSGLHVLLFFLKTNAVFTRWNPGLSPRDIQSYELFKKNQSNREQSGNKKHIGKMFNYPVLVSRVSSSQIMNWSEVVDFDELSEPECIHHADSFNLCFYSFVFLSRTIVVVITFN